MIDVALRVTGQKIRRWGVRVSKQTDDHIGPLTAVGYILTAIPIAHLILCTVFLAGYGYSFGHNITSLFTFSDILNVSVIYMPFVYCVGLAMPACIYAVLLISSGKDKLFRRAWEQPTEKSAPVLKDVRKIAFEAALAGTAILTSVGFAAYAIIYFEYIRVEIVCAMIAYLALEWAGYKLQLRKVSLIGIQLLFTFVIFSFAAGTIVARRDLEVTYLSNRDSIRCQHAEIVHRVSDYFIVVFPDNKKALVDNSCAIKFSLPR